MYDGAEHKYIPVVTSAEGAVLVEGTDYDVSYSTTDYTNVTGKITVTITGKGNYSGTVTREYEITKRPVTLTSEGGYKTYDGSPLTKPTVTVGGEGFVDGEVSNVRATGSVTTVAQGKVTNTITFDEGTVFKADNYEISKTEGELYIEPQAFGGDTGASVDYPTNHVYDGEEHKYEPFVTDAQGNTLVKDRDYTVDYNGTTDFTNVTGTITVTITGIGNYGGSVTRNYQITPRPVTLTSATASKQYDGTPLTAEKVTVSEATETSGFVGEEGVEGYENFASVILPNETKKNTFKYTLKTNTKAGNYDIKVVEGTLTINPRAVPYAIIVTVNSGEQEYNATAFTVSGFESIKGAGITGNAANMTFVLNGKTFTITGIDASRTETHVNPAEPANQGGVDVLPYTGYEVSVNGTAVIQDEAGNDVTSQFNVGTVPGVLTITPRKVTLTSASDSKKFDKSPLTNENVTVTSGSFAYGDGATYHVTGTQTRIGSSANEFTYTLTGGAIAQDYRIEYIYGKLTVTPPDDYEIVEKSHEARDGVYRLGDTINFTITVENIFDAEATVTITEQEGVEFLNASGNKIGNTYPETTLAAGETLTVSAVYTVQEKDLLEGGFTNNVSVTIKATVDETDYEGGDEDTDTVEDLEQPDPELTVVKTTTSSAKNPALGYAVGETITYEITVTNTGNLTIHDIQVSDLISTAEEPVELTLKGFDGTLAPNESVTFTFEHTVVEEDLGKTITNEAIATGKNDTEDEDYDGEQIPTDVDDEKAKTEDKTEPIRRGLTITKEITNSQEIYKLGSPIQYRIVVTNTGNVTERNLVVVDEMINAAHVDANFRYTNMGGGNLSVNNAVLTSLAPGDVWVITCEYKIGGGDESNVVGNKATVTSDAVETVTSNTVEAQVETQYALTIYYVDENWQVIAGTYWKKMSVGDHYNITSPTVPGYTAERKVVMSGKDGMPEKDVEEWVRYIKDPEEEETTDPTETTTTDPTETEPTYDLTPLPDDKTPLADVDLDGDHTCCIMHFLLMLLSMILLGFYTSDRKKLQKSIFELKRALKNEGVNVGSDDGRKA